MSEALYLQLIKGLGQGKPWTLPTLIIVGFELKHIELQKDRWEGMPSRATYRRTDWNICLPWSKYIDGKPKG